MDYKEFSEIFNIELDPQQEAAVTDTSGQILLLAVPGSGKTTTLVCRVGFMIYVEGISPSDILVMTFTRAAARDMKERFADIFGPEYALRLRFRTINALSEHILSRYCSETSKKKPSLLKDNSALICRLWQEIYRSYPASNDIRSMQLAITRAKNLQLSADEISGMEVEGRPFASLYKAYQRHLRMTGQMDFDDQMVYAHSIMTRCPGYLSVLQSENPYILVDEAQDTSKIQHEMIGLLASKSRHIFMVGDEDQSIYGFRAACPEALMDFGKRYPDARIMKLEQNYRSTPEIVTLANVFIRQNKRRYGKRMFAGRSSCEKVKFIKIKKREDQYSAIASKLAFRWVGETAVIYRNNESAIPLIAELMKQNIPFRCRGMDTVFFGSRTVSEIKDILLSALEPSNSGLFMKTFSLFDAHISSKAARRAAEAADRNPSGSFWDALYFGDEVSKKYKPDVKAISQGLAGIRRSDNVREALDTIRRIGYKRSDDDRFFILKALAEPGESICDFISRLDELGQAMANASYNRNVPLVLTTIHSSKGLEYDNVIVMDEISPVFPDIRSDIEEERRLFYVAITRAKNNLVLLSYDDRRQPFIDSIGRKIKQPG